jgi:hypothetical protein
MDSLMYKYDICSQICGDVGQMGGRLFVAAEAQCKRRYSARVNTIINAEPPLVSLRLLHSFNLVFSWN